MIVHHNTLKYFFLFFLCISAGLFLPAATSAAPATVNAKAAVVMDAATGKILFSQNPNQQIAPASLTKVLAMYTAFEIMKTKNLSPDKTYVMSKNAASTGGSRMGLRTGEKVSLDNLLAGIAIGSGNDATVAIAESLGGSTTAFVKLMNTNAQKLGMTKSAFFNPNGLPAPKQLTTAKDMATLVKEYIKRHPQGLYYHGQRAFKHNNQTIINKNPLLGKIEGVDGLKSGWIVASGYNLITTSIRGNQRIIVVILGAPTASVRGQETHRLIEATFTSLKGKQTVAQLLTTMPPAKYYIDLKESKINAVKDLNLPKSYAGNLGAQQPPTILPSTILVQGFIGTDLLSVPEADLPPAEEELTSTQFAVSGSIGENPLEQALYELRIGQKQKENTPSTPPKTETAPTQIKGSIGVAYPE